MLYQEYKQRLSKRMNAFEKAWKYRFLILLVFVLIIAAIIATLLGITGRVYGATFQKSVVYGEEFVVDAKAVFRKTSFEFREKGTEEWTEHKPLRVGEYEFRAIAKSITGSKRYGKIYTYGILPRQTELTVSEQSLRYGETLNAFAELAYSDQLERCSFHYKWLSDGECTVTAAVESVLDANGEDVTDCYDFISQECRVGIRPRPIAIEVDGGEKIYDGTPLKVETYRIASGAFAEGDWLKISFPTQQLQVGEVKNTPVFSIVDRFGADVTGRYDVTLTLGTLKVAPRELILRTDSAEKVYDALPLSCPEFSVVSGSELAAGHRIEAAECTAVTDVGVYENIATAKIINAGGQDVTSCYRISYVQNGTLRITPRPITVKSDDMSFRYDGETHSHPSAKVVSASGLAKPVPRQELRVDEILSSIREVGQTENLLRVSIFDNETLTDVTANYEITFIAGTLRMTLGKITIWTGSETWIYDGEAHSLAAPSDYGLELDGDNTMECSIELSPESIVTVRDITDSETLVGYVENSLQFRIVDGNGAVQNENFEISYEYGRLRIKREIVIIVYSIAKYYDGTPLEFQSKDYSILKPPDVNVGLAFPTITDVGTVGFEALETVPLFITDHSGNDVRAENRWRIEGESGVPLMQIFKRQIEITSISIAKLNTGKTLRGNIGENSAWVSRGSLAQGHTVTVNVTGELLPKEIGPKENTIESVVIYDSTGKDVTENYEISYCLGLLSWI